MTPPMNQCLTLLERVERLERDNRRLKSYLVVALLLITSLGVMAQSTSPRFPFLTVGVLEVEQITVRQEDGKGRRTATLGMADGNPILIFGDDGKPSLSNGFFMAYKEDRIGAAFFTRDHRMNLVADGIVLNYRGRERAGLLSSDRGVMLTMADNGQEKRLSIGTFGDGASFVNLWDPQGKTRWQFAGTDPRPRGKE